MMAHQVERGEHLTCEAANQCSREAHKIVGLDELVKVDTEELHRNTQMVAEIEVLRHLDDIMFLFRILG